MRSICWGQGTPRAAGFEAVSRKDSQGDPDQPEADHSVEGKVFAVDQHTKRTRITGEFTFKAAGEVEEADVQSGALVTINASDSTYGNRTGYVRSWSQVRAKADYMKIRFEATSWPALGS